MDRRLTHTGIPTGQFLLVAHLMIPRTALVARINIAGKHRHTTHEYPRGRRQCRRSLHTYHRRCCRGRSNRSPFQSHLGRRQWCRKWRGAAIDGGQQITIPQSLASCRAERRSRPGTDGHTDRSTPIVRADGCDVYPRGITHQWYKELLIRYRAGCRPAGDQIEGRMTLFEVKLLHCFGINAWLPGPGDMRWQGERFNDRRYSQQ